MTAGKFRSKRVSEANLTRKETEMTISNVRPKVWLLSAFVLFLCVMTAAASAEEPKHPQPSGIGSISLRQPFNIFSACPPAGCYAFWNGEDTSASANSDFTPAGVPVAFAFTTGAPITWQCNQEYEYCEATYGVGGTFTVTGALGRFTGQITSGSVYADGQAFELFVSFTGQWGNGQAMHSGASYVYEEANGIPNTELNMSPGP